jgi:hypothetical protein
MLGDLTQILWLAQTRPLTPSGAASVIFWSAVLIGLIVVAFLAYAQFKRWMSDSGPTSSGPGFTLSDLRQLHREGKMTDEEYEQARAKMVASAKKMADSLPDPLANRRQPPMGKPEPGSTTRGPSNP